MVERPGPDRHELALCAHDLRGALTVIAGYTDVLRHRDLPTEERERALDGITAAIRRADAMLSETLEGKRRPMTAEEQVRVSAIARTAVADARASSGRDVRLHIDGDPVVTGDEVALSRALENLVGNAIKYAPEGPVDVTVNTRIGVVSIAVEDRGPGVPAGQREAVVEPFTRLKRDEAAEGTGLGLTVVASVAKRHHGTLRIEDREGGGARFVLEVPVAGV